MACGYLGITHPLSSCGSQPDWEADHPDFCFAFDRTVSIFVVSLRLHMVLIYIVSGGDRAESYRSGGIWKGQNWGCPMKAKAGRDESCVAFWGVRRWVSLGWGTSGAAQCNRHLYNILAFST